VFFYHQIFLFRWIPTLTDSEATLDLPVLYIYGTFMICCMAGSCMYNVITEHWKDDQIASASLAGASLAMVLTLWSSDTTWKYLAMNMFQIMVGMYRPSISTVKASIVPERARAAIYSVYDIPLKLVVIITLVSNLTSDQFFGLNALMLALAAGLQIWLMKRRELLSNVLKSESTTGKPTTEMIIEDDGVNKTEKLAA